MDPPFSGSPKCWSCYYYFFWVLTYEGTDDLRGDCLPRSDVPGFASNSKVLKAKEIFRECAGYDIDFPGGPCTGSEVASVEPLTPWRSSVDCAFNYYCDPGLISEIESRVSTNCALCYRELQADIWRSYNALPISDGELCIDIFEVRCWNQNQLAYERFHKCSGHYINIRDPAATPNGCNTPTITTTITPPITTTEAPSDTATTRSSSAPKLSAVLLILSSCILTLW
jgi:hypothetical protein